MSRLMENLRLRRAGFAYRHPYAQFLQRYKMLSRRTWPNWNGPFKKGVDVLLKDLRTGAAEYALGATKVFIRNPTTVSIYRFS